ncbi:DNA polymerase III subunit gamma/tau [Parazoarcus communis]|uniref:DNA polymerase III subunit gamma/tau n=1 Tax=Parazoarcus communis SWub3 = DSM 12120 TaxID=1121029 RepID=A0A323UPE7_9RHOO|nr:DNA polymerase III subunit gamma/tau [Parazoarcus communis]NMG72213.1 DNA polymerase III subunit gamma/tau [Parazoarcus communis SWub3 = DSM 12120]PZA14852.1 DNA polymerase III subunit gamma/tau [Azoarcus communis] [Parazoarcus communis SWub3 = DSM 12120]
MSYQVLARKWRPRSFGTLVGQEHVVRALSHALETGRLHHAWLFTGTRGVGKTTISRILAKALNCETGITAEPCGVCDACKAIDADRFADYVEMDAASNRGVDDMAALLDKAVYAPVQGRYKVYMIDEVHMLTGHAFNAMLKTLEEPPEHVKFILATTDPQKIPVTVLSRCLQFNLKQMPPGHIVDHLSRILEAEAVPFEAGALRHIAKGASGSMRDALSLLDQAIAHGAGKVLEEQVTHMLGTVGDDHLHAVLDALAAGQMDAMLAVADAMEARSLSFDAALQALASLLGRVALVQFAPTAVADEVERQRLLAHAAQFDAEFLQLAYQIVIHGRDELALAPDEYTGFAMTLLRLHAFRPEQPPALGSSGGAAPQGGTTMARKLPPSASASGRAAVSGEASSRASVGLSSAAAGKAAVPAASDSARVASEVASPVAASASPMPGPSRDVAPWEDLPPEALLQDDSYTGQVGAPDEVVEEPSQLPRQPKPAEASRQPLGPRDGGALRTLTPPATGASAEVAGSGPDTPALRQAFDRADWRGVIRALGLGGLVREFAQHCEWLGFADDQLDLRLSETHRHLLEMNRAAVDRVQDMLSAGLARPIRVRIATGAIAGETPAQRDEVERRARHAEAVAALECDPFVRELIERFDATLVEASVRPL